MCRRSLAFILVLFPFFTYAEITETSVNEGDKLVVIGLNAQVNLLFVPGATNLKISGLQSDSGAGRYFLEKSDKEIRIRMKDFGSKRDWKEALGGPELANEKIEISGATLPVEIQLRSGSVQMKNWNKDVKVNLGHGKILAEKCSGSLDIHQQKGEILITDQTGKFNIDAYSSILTLKKISTDAEINLFSGQLNAEKMSGHLLLISQNAQTKLSKSEGSFHFDMAKGNVIAQSFRGRIEGQLNEGSATISPEAESEINLRGVSGRLTVQLPAQSGASLNLLTNEGDIFVPNEIKVNRRTMEKSVRGKLSGESKSISVFVRSQEGNIQIK